MTGDTGPQFWQAPRFTPGIHVRGPIFGPYRPLDRSVAGQTRLGEREQVRQMFTVERADDVNFVVSHGDGHRWTFHFFEDPVTGRRSVSEYPSVRQNEAAPTTAAQFEHEVIGFVVAKARGMNLVD